MPKSTAGKIFSSKLPPLSRVLALVLHGLVERNQKTTVPASVLVRGLVDCFELNDTTQTARVEAEIQKLANNGVFIVRPKADGSDYIELDLNHPLFTESPFERLAHKQQAKKQPKPRVSVTNQCLSLLSKDGYEEYVAQNKQRLIRLLGRAQQRITQDRVRDLVTYYCGLRLRVKLIKPFDVWFAATLAKTPRFKCALCRRRAPHTHGVKTQKSPL